MGRLRIIGKETNLMHYETVQGEEELNWIKNNDEQTDKARQMFQKYFMKGWIAYTVTHDNKNKQIFSFSPELEEIVLVPIVSGG